MATTSQPPMIRALLSADAYDYQADAPRLIETHISWVILYGDYAFKLKKPLDLGFLDFSTVDKRRRCCEEEIRLNRRLAPDLYLDVVPVTDDGDRIRVGGNGEIIEYAVRMRRFPQACQMDEMLLHEQLQSSHIDAIADRIVRFHRLAPPAAADSEYVSPGQVYRPVAENFEQIRGHITESDHLASLQLLEDWALAEHQRLLPCFTERAQSGFIRECHGDLHLRNLAWFEGQPIAFDCLEFNESLRWIDVMSDLAFLVMDLRDLKQAPMARRLLNRYLEQGGDYGGLRVLRFYLVYRALVRAKVAAIRLAQPDLAAEEVAGTRDDFEGYLKLAETFTVEARPSLVITHGLSGSGKSTVAGQLVEQDDFIRIRSDVERKRLFGCLEDESSPDRTPQPALYSVGATERTYQKLAELAGFVIAGGFKALVDATFLDFQQRQRFRALAADCGVAFTLLDIAASPDILRSRARNRTDGVSDADLEVLEKQLEAREPLRLDERTRALTVDTEAPPDAGELAAALWQKMFGV